MIRTYSYSPFRILKLGVNLLVSLFLIFVYSNSDGKLFNLLRHLVISLKSYTALTGYSTIFPSLSK